MKAFVKKLLFFAGMIFLVGASAFAGGISVGNGKHAYISPKGFSVAYEAGLTLDVKSETDFRITNEKLVEEKQPASRVAFRVSEEGIQDLQQLQALILGRHPRMKLRPFTLAGARGYYFEAKLQGGIKGRYFLIAAGGELLDIELDAYEAGRGLELVAPIVRTLSYDIKPPKVGAVWVESPLWPAGSKQKIFFRATDDISGVSTRMADAFFREVGKDRGRHLFGYRVQEEGGDTYSLEIETNRYMAPGRFELQSLRVFDNASNFVNHSPLEKIVIEITNSGVVDETPPAWLGFRNDHSTWRVGETKRVYFRAHDSGSGLDVSSFECFGLKSVFEIRGFPRSIGSCEDPRDEGDGWYSVALAIDPFQPGGEYILDHLQIEDRAGMELVLYVCDNPGPFYCDISRKEITSYPVFKIRLEAGELLDLQDPEILEIRFESTVWKVGETQRMLVRAKDNLSGVSYSLDARPQLQGWVRPEKEGVPGARTIYLDQPLMPLGGDWYFMDIEVNPHLRAGDYYLGRFSIHDRAGNYSSIECGYEGMPKSCQKTTGGEMDPIRIQVVR